MSIKIALATCNDLPDWEVDDKPLVDALTSCGVVVHTPSWTANVDWNSYDATVIRTTWDYHLHFDAFLAWSMKVPRLFNNASIVKWNTHKSYLYELEQLGIKIAPTIWIQQGQTVHLSSIMKNLCMERGLIKPLIGANASNTMRFDYTQMKEAQIFLDARSHLEMMVQPYIQSVETEGELSAIFIHGEYTHGVQKIPVVGDYRVQDDHGATDHPYIFDSKEIAVMQNLFSCLHFEDELLYARVDYLRGNNGGLLLNELELVEPSLFFRHSNNAAEKFANAIIKVC